MGTGGMGRVQVLIVDDNRPMRILVRSLIRAIGLRQTLEANDPAEGFDILRNNNIDLVITDLAMKPLDGIEFCTMLRRSPDSPNPYVPVIMMTGHAERARVAAARDSGVTTFLVKPLSAKSLIDHINKAIHDNRPFVRSQSYFGPDRRCWSDRDYSGKRRRASDLDSGALDL